MANPAPKPATAAERPNMPNLPKLLQETYIYTLNSDHAARVQNREELRARVSGNQGPPLPYQPPVPPAICANPHNTLAEAHVDDHNTTFLVLLNAPETDFWNHYTPSYLRPKEPNPQWSFLPQDPRYMAKRRLFANKIIGAHRIIQQDLDAYVQSGLFDKTNILPPIFTVCPITNNWYPTKDYNPARDPFLHIQPVIYPPEMYNCVFEFPDRQPHINSNPTHRAASADAMATYAGYNDPYLPRHQAITPSVIYSIVKDGAVSGGPRGPWEMIPTTIKRVIGRSFRRADKEALRATRAGAASPWERYNPFDNIFHGPHCHPTATPSPNIATGAPSSAATATATSTQAQQPTKKTRKAKTDSGSKKKNDSTDEVAVEDTDHHNTSVEIIDEVAGNPATTPTTRPTKAARSPQPATSTPSKATNRPLFKRPLKRGSMIGGPSCAHAAGPSTAAPTTNHTSISRRTAPAATASSQQATAPAPEPPAVQPTLRSTRRCENRPQQSPPRPPRRHSTDRDTIRGLRAELNANRDTIQGLRTELNRSLRSELAAISHSVDRQTHHRRRSRNRSRTPPDSARRRKFSRS